MTYFHRTAAVVASPIRIFEALMTHGADQDRIEPQLDMALSHYYQFELVGKSLTGQVEPDPMI